MIFSGENVTSQTQSFGGRLFQIHQQISVRTRRGQFEGLTHVVSHSGIHLFGEMCDLRPVPGVLEHHQIVGIQANGAMILVSIEEVLYDVNDADVSMMNPFSE